MIAIDRLCYNSKLRKKNSGVKFAFSVTTLLICVVSRSPAAALAALAVNGLLTVAGGGVSFREDRKFMTIPLVFMLLSTLAIVVNLSDRPLDLFAIPLAGRYLTGSREGLRYAAQLILTAMASVSSLYFLSMTTPMPDILGVLDDLRCPRLLSELMLLIYRYIFVLLDTASNIRISQACRLGNKDYRTSLKSFAALGSVLMMRAIVRSKALYDAMEARCYDGRIQVLKEGNPPQRRDVVLVCVWAGILLILAFGRRLLWM